MSFATFEGIVEAGQIRLLNGKGLPEQTRVYVLIPDYSEDETPPAYPVTIPLNPRVVSPRLAKREDAEHFRLQMSETTDAGI